MRFYDENSWKKKIDPAFDKSVKTYLKFLREIENIPDDEQVSFEDVFSELISTNPDLSADYKNESIIEILQFIKDVGLVTEDQIEFFFNSINTIEEYNELMKGLQKDGSRITSSQSFILSKITSLLHSLIIHAEKLPEEESKQYYANKINVFIEDIRTKHCIQFPKDFVLILLSLFLRFFSNKLEEINNKSAVKEGIEYLKNPIVISTVIGFLNSIISQLSHKKEMCELLDNVDKGDEKSFFKAITIDKTLISSECVEKGIIKSRASGDKEFQTKLGNAIVKSPLESVDRHGETYAVLNLFWDKVLYKLNYQELYYFLKSCGLKLHDYQDAFDKFMQRHIKKNK